MEWESRSLSVKKKKQNVEACDEEIEEGEMITVSVCKEVVVPCCIKEPTPNQKLLRSVKLFSTTSEPGLQGWASYHSYGLNLRTGKRSVGNCFFIRRLFLVVNHSTYEQILFSYFRVPSWIWKNKTHYCKDGGLRATSNFCPARQWNPSPFL